MYYIIQNTNNEKYVGRRVEECFDNVEMTWVLGAEDAYQFECKEAAQGFAKFNNMIACKLVRKNLPRKSAATNE